MTTTNLRSEPSRNRASRPTRTVLLVAVLLATLTGIGAARAEPAGAATATASASVCFKAYAPAVSGFGTYTYAVNIDVWWSGAPAQLATVLPASDGCIRGAQFPAGYYWRYRVANCIRGAGCYYGSTQWLWAAAGGTLRFGTLYLYPQ